MKLLLTGATGFLGKQLLELLLADSRITHIWVTTRNKRSHPNPKVEVIRINLADPSQLFQLDILPDAVIHLAGLYDFEESYENCYTQNLLPALHLARKAREWNQSKRVPIYFASTYAVTYGQDLSAAEEPLTALPPPNIPYAYTKAMAERAITDSGVPSAIFRLGILVGKSTDGAMDKLDGAYAFVRLMEASRPLTKFLKRIPLPAKADGILPLVPVDAAARIFHEAIFRPEVAFTPAQIYGAYDPRSIPIREFAESVLAKYAPGASPVFFERIPKSVLDFQSRLTPVSADAFKFALKPVAIQNPRFQKVFLNSLIPHFKSYEHAFYSGYRMITRGLP
ncbi:MAG: SDR family oxidoreductase [Bdellovibrionia bacterium]